MNSVFIWVGFITVTGLTLAIGIAAWWFVIDRLHSNMRETWWMASWILYKRGDTERAKESLATAIRIDAVDTERVVFINTSDSSLGLPLSEWGLPGVPLTNPMIPPKHELVIRKIKFV